MIRDFQPTRRQVLFAGAAAGLAPTPPVSRVAIARARNYDAGIYDTLKALVDKAGGLGAVAKGKTVALKLNLTGNPERFPVKAGLPYRTDPSTVLALCQLLAKAGARRIRILESFFPARQDMALWARYGLDIRAIDNCGTQVEWENTNNLGRGTQYTHLKVPFGGYVFPAYHLNHSYADCDSYVSLSKLKNHWLAGITMTMKNNFGLTPCSLYGSDAGASGNEDPKQERGAVGHNGTRTPPQGVPQELKPESPREPGYRVPRIVVDLCAIRPVDFSVVDGIDTIRGGEGEWNSGVERISPGLLLAGRNQVCVDTVCAAVMSYDPRGVRGTGPFIRGDNTLLLAEAVGLGSADLSKIEIAGLQMKDARMDFGPGPTGKRIGTA
ncbi:MAG: DUF362 domain-containing protein [Acidobacteria bacterium]|nr:DUF362 domain-containing protein [Acidobacteriota bacterium]